MQSHLRTITIPMSAKLVIIGAYYGANLAFPPRCFRVFSFFSLFFFSSHSYPYSLTLFFFFFSLCLIFNRSHNCLPVLPYPFLLFYTVSNNPLSLSFLSFYPVEMYILKTVMAVPCTKGVDYLLASFVQFPPSLVPLNGSQSDIQCDIC